jgi:hypothetical protein
MRTLNKTLSLVLVLVMCLGFFGVASAATTKFTDDATIQYKEAVATMAGFGAIAGYTDGSFKPAGAVTRAEAAKLVTYAVLGATVAKTLPTVSTGFTDIDANTQSWAGASIAYLASKGVLNGRGDGTFDPTGKITAFEIAKMMLCAAGYGANGEYTGTSWQLNVAIDAAKYGIFTGTKATDLSAAATREECALYAFNGLTKVELVAYNKTTGVYVQADGGTGTTVDNTLATSVYGYLTAVGVITDNQATTANAYTTVRVVGVDGDGNPTYTATNFNIATGLDLVGHYVKITYKSTYTSTTVPGVAYSVTDLSTVVTAAKAITTATAWKTAFGTDTITNSVAANSSLFSSSYADSTGAIGGLTIGSAAAAGTYILYKGDIKAYLAPTTYDADVVISYTAPTATGTGLIDLEDNAVITIPKTGDTTSGTALTYATYSIYATPAKGDVVIITATGDLTTIAKATTATGKVTGVNLVADPDTITAGSTYSKSAAFDTYTNLTGSVDFTSAATLNKNCTFYLAADGTVVAIALVDETTDAGLAYVVGTYYEKDVDLGYGVTIPTYWVQCVGMDGKEVNYQIAGKNDNHLGAPDAVAAGLYSITTATDSVLKATVATLTDANSIATEGTTTHATSDTTAIEATALTIAANNYFDANTKFLFVENSGATLKVTAATGVQATDGVDTYYYYGTKASTDSNYTVKYVVVAGAPVATASTSVMFVPQAFTTANAVSYTKADGTSGTAYSNVAFIDGAPNTSVLVTDVTGLGLGFYTVSKDATTGIYTLTPTYAGVGYGKVTNVYDSYVTVAGALGNGTNAYAPGSLTDKSAAGAFINDVPYLADMLLYAGAHGFTQHTTLASLLNTSVYFSYKTVSGVTTITGIYFMSAIQAAVTPTTHAVDAAGNTDLLTAAVTSAITGDSYTYQWVNASTGIIAGETNATYDPSAAGTYYCVVTDAYGYQAQSNSASIT